MIFETHAHLDDERFDTDRDTLFTQMQEKGIGRVINVSASIDGVKASIDIAKKYEFAYAAVGVHPDEIDGLNEDSFLWIGQQAANPNVVAIGEIGLDYHRSREGDVCDNQKYWFSRQMDLAREAKKPLIIHSRDAAQDTYEIMKLNHAGDIGGVIHCYSYSPEMAEQFVAMGFYIGVGGVVTFKNAKKLRETVERISLDRILLETDSPYLAPEPFRGRRNDPTLLKYVVEQIAAIKNIAADEVEDVTWDNACRLFGLESVR